MRFKKRITLMKPSELRGYQDTWLKRIVKFQPHTLGWRFCSRRIRLIQEQIVLTGWILAGLKKMNSDKIDD